MKRTVELDADEILNSLTKVRNRLHVARLACEGLASDDGGGKLIASMILEIEQDLTQISGKLSLACASSCSELPLTSSIARYGEPSRSCPKS